MRPLQRASEFATIVRARLATLQTCDNGLQTLAVALIVGVLMALALHGFTITLNKVAMSEVPFLLGGARVGPQEFRAVNGRWPASSDLPLSDIGDSFRAGRYVARIDLDESGALRFTMGENWHNAGAHLSLRAWRGPGEPEFAVMWTCGASPGPERFAADAPNVTTANSAFLPSFCR